MHLYLTLADIDPLTSLSLLLSRTSYVRSTALSLDVSLESSKLELVVSSHSSAVGQTQSIHPWPLTSLSLSLFRQRCLSPSIYSLANLNWW